MSRQKKSAHYDVVIVGAGLSGIGSAYHLQDKCPDLSYTILEARESMGGTWDLFRYPGIRSDSDMYTLGFSFHPWKVYQNYLRDLFALKCGSVQDPYLEYR